MDAFPNLVDRDANSHKGMFGHALIVGGATGMSGAAAIAGMACLRCGAGLVTLVVPQASHAIVASFEPSYMVAPIACDAKGRFSDAAWNELQPYLEKATCIAIGPGLGRSPASDQLVHQIVHSLPKPMVIDADALNALDGSSLEWHDETYHRPVRILTPHPGEWQRLTGVTSKDREAQIQSAREFAARHGCVVVLKGSRTFITDGQQEFINETGNPSMATGGSGDALTGIITAFLCQQLPPFVAASAGVYLHGRAGDLAHRSLQTPNTLPTDLLRYLPDAFLTVYPGKKT